MGLYFNTNELKKIMSFCNIQIANQKEKRFYCPQCGGHNLQICKDSGNRPAFLKCWNGCANLFAFGLVKNTFNLSNYDTYRMLEEILNKKFENANIIYNTYDKYKLPKITKTDKEDIRDYELFKSITKAPNEKNMIQFINDNIPLKVLNVFGVRYRYDKEFSQHQICIPNFDANNNFLGVNCRNFKYNLNKKYKYTPLNYKNEYWRTKVGSVLFGLNINKESIANTGEAMLVESQKAVMQAYDYGYRNCVGTFGMNNIQPYKIAMLKKYGVKTFIFALDKEYPDEESYYKYMNKICSVADIIKKNIVDSKCYIMQDLSLKDRILKQKEAPTDRGKEIFYKLYKMKKEIKRETIDMFLNKN